MLARSPALLAVFLLVPVARADDAADADAKVKEYLKGIKGAEAARVTPLAADGMKESFPDHNLFAVLFPLYPVARIAPEPLKHANVIAVPKKKDAKPVLITDAKELEKFFKENAREVKKAADADDVVKAWLRASAELNQDGYYKFTVKGHDKTKVEGGTVTTSGEVTVDPANGDKGGINAALAFKDGKFVSAETKVLLIAGMRPRCQATKLLDADPIVRLMAEDSLRVMGSGVKPYLDEQRAKASPELRDAIDRVWAKIIAEGR